MGKVASAGWPTGLRATADVIDAEKGTDTMVKLYRHVLDAGHWYVSLPEARWVEFPAKANGWTERRPVLILRKGRLQHVPLRVVFNTGLVEALAEWLHTQAASRRRTTLANLGSPRGTPHSPLWLGPRVTCSGAARSQGRRPVLTILQIES